MPISIKTRKMLWGRAASRCAFCQVELIGEATEADPACVIGEECHIVAASSDGPRGDSPLSLEQRDNYENLILLCPTHHKLVDSQSSTHTVQALMQLKAKHEEWVGTSLTGYDSVKQREDEYYAEIVQEFSQGVDLDDWAKWTSRLLSNTHSEIFVDRFTRLVELRNWLFSRIWHDRYPELEISLKNFHLVLQDLMLTIDKHSTECEFDDVLVYRTPRFYKIPEWDDKRYHRLLNQYLEHIYLLHDLVYELTRAANFVCDSVRKQFDPAFRLKEGALLLESGASLGESVCKRRPEYTAAEKATLPYPGLMKFKKARWKRDYCCAKESQDRASIFHNPFSA